MACPAYPKVVLKIQNHQNWPHQFFRIKNSPGVMLPVFAFFGSKNIFFDYLDISLALKQPNLQHAESHSNFWF